MYRLGYAGDFFTSKPSPEGGGDPAGPDEGRVCRGFPFMGYNGKPAPHQSAGGAADSFPRRGKPFYLQSLPPWGCARRRVSKRNRRRRLLARRLKVAPQGRMRGEFAAASRLWGIMANLPLISQRAGPLTASPEGGKVAPQGRMRGRVCRGFPFMGYNGKPAPHQSAGGAADSSPQGGSLFTLRKKRSARR